MMCFGLQFSDAYAADLSPQQDLDIYRAYFAKKFPQVEFDNFADGVYAINKAARYSWQAIREFPPYEPMIDEGKIMWEKPFANGKTYKDCFPDGPAIQHQYPRWQKQRGVITLPMAINNCRIENKEKVLEYATSPFTNLLAYIAYQSRNKTIETKIPNTKAEAAYQSGKKYYFARRGQLNFSCAQCHFENAGKRLRGEMISPALGHSTHWPAYWSELGELGTLHRRFMDCNNLARARWLKPQSEDYRNLEYFISHLDNGLRLNGPSTRR